MKRVVVAFALVAPAFVTLAGCEDNKPPAPEPITAQSGAAASGSVSPRRPAGSVEKFTDVEIDAEQIPTPQDYEETAIKEVTVENYVAELDKVAGEIEADAPADSTAPATSGAPKSSASGATKAPPAH
jgi:hypothetical protein